MVTPDGVIEDGVVRIVGGRISEVRPTGRIRTVHYRAAWVLPGFVDIHVHGGGGHTFTTGDPEQARAAALFHRRHGTTTMLASLVTAPARLLREATKAFAPLIADGVLAGVHLEGPYLAPTRCGAQNPAHLRDPDLGELKALVALGGVAMVTLAPELPRSLDAIRLLVDHGVVAAVGHTDATYEETIAAVAAGATARHPPLQRHAPGPSSGSWPDRRATRVIRRRL